MFELLKYVCVCMCVCASVTIVEVEEETAHVFVVDLPSAVGFVLRDNLRKNGRRPNGEKIPGQPGGSPV